MEYHLRLSIQKTNALVLLNAFCASFKPAEVVSCYEFTKIEDDGTIINPHTHSYLKYNKEPTKQAISAFFKKWQYLLLKPTKETAGYSHKKQKKGTEENIVYTIKGGDYLQNTIGDDIVKYKEKTELINMSKTLSSREKIYNEWVLKNGIVYPSSKFNIFKFIDELYVLKYRKTPLAIGHKISYSIYLLMEIHNNINNKEEYKYNELLTGLYNINNEETRWQENLKTDEEVIKQKKPLNIKKMLEDRKKEYETDSDNIEFISDDETEIICDF